jgi:hypothetical protein
MNDFTRTKLKSVSAKLDGILVELNGITATGADGIELTTDERTEVCAVRDTVGDNVATINGITATGAD